MRRLRTAGSRFSPDYMFRVATAALRATLAIEHSPLRGNPVTLPLTQRAGQRERPPLRAMRA